MRKVASVLLIAFMFCFLSGCDNVHTTNLPQYGDIAGNYVSYADIMAKFSEEDALSGMTSHNMKLSMNKEASRAKINITTCAKAIDEYYSRSGISQTVVSNVKVNLTSESESGFIVNVHYVPFSDSECYVSDFKQGAGSADVWIDQVSTKDPEYTNFDDGELCVTYNLAAYKGYDSGIFTASSSVEYTTYFTPDGSDNVTVIKFSSPILTAECVELPLVEF